MYTIFVRKPRVLDEIAQNAQDTDRKEWVEITEKIELTPEQYDAFWRNPTCGSYHFLTDKGGYRDSQRTAVVLTCGNRDPIIVDPSGSDYGRYVGFEVPV